MFKRLFVLLLLVAATIVVSPPVHASTLTISGLSCIRLASPYAGRGYYRCDAGISGGTGAYLSYTWTVSSTWEPTYSFVTSTPYMERTCAWNHFTGTAGLQVQLTVTDSAGATAGAATRVQCHGGDLE